MTDSTDAFDPEAVDAQDNSGYRLMPGLPPHVRNALGGGLILAGLALQLWTLDAWIGSALVGLGNLWFLVRGVRNSDASMRAALRDDAPWEVADVGRLREIVEMDRSIARWDRSVFDSSNPLGGFVFLLLLAACGGMLFFGYAVDSPVLRIVGADAAVLFLPHWLSGMRRGRRFPVLTLRADLLDAVLKASQADLKDHTVEALFQFPEKGAPVPVNTKLRIRRAGMPESFIGMELHVAINDVQGVPNPYGYAVLIAKTGANLGLLAWEGVRNGLLAEHKVQPDVEVLVIRQKTSKNGGYRTENRTVLLIVKTALAAMDALASD